MKRFFHFGVWSFLLLACSASAFTTNDVAKIIGSDGTYADSSNAVTYVQGKAQNGWVLTLGTAGGSYTWDRNLVVSIPYVTTLTGASSNNRPTITTSNRIYLYGTHGNTLTFKDIIFTNCTDANSVIQVHGSGDDVFRLSNLHFAAGTVGYGIWVGAPGTLGSGARLDGPFGVIDRCTTYDKGLVFVRQNRNTPDNAFTVARLSWGTKRAVFMEDCVMSYGSLLNGGLVDGNDFAKICVRSNDITNARIAVPHGPDSSGPTNSLFQLELYDNIQRVTSGATGANQMNNANWIRGGTARVKGNQLLMVDDADGSTEYNTYGALAFFGMQVHCADSGSYSAEGCQWPDGVLLTDTTTSSTRTAPNRGLALQYPSEYPSVQNIGQLTDGTVKVYIWENTGWYQYLPGYTSAFVVQDREFETNAPPGGHLNYTYPHPLRTAAVTTVQRLGSFGSGNGSFGNATGSFGGVP